MLDDSTATDDLQLAFETLAAKGPHHDLRWSYYHGNHPLKFASKQLQDAFGKHWKDAAFVENWISVIATTSLDRLELERLEVSGSEPLTNKLDAMFENLNLELDAEDLTLDVLVTGEGYIVAWQDAEGRVTAYHNDSRQVHAFPDAEDPRKTRLGAKWWREDKTTVKITLYYADRLEYWTGQVRDDGDLRWSPGEWTMEDSAPNPFGTVPVFRFTTNRFGQSDIDKAIPIQDGINKAIADLSVSADYASFPQRWAITNADLGASKPPLGPRTLIQFTPGEEGVQNTEVGTFEAADMQQFLSVVESKSLAMAAVTSTPKHFFWSAGAQVPSGEALIAMEAPLNRKIQRYQRRLGAVWSDVARFLLRLSGESVSEDTLIVPVWIPGETIQPRTRAEIREINVRAGMPFPSLLREEGYTKAEIDRIGEELREWALAQPLPVGESQVETADLRAAAVDSAAVAEAVTLLSDGLLDRLVQSGALDRLIEARRS